MEKARPEEPRPTGATAGGGGGTGAWTGAIATTTKVGGSGAFAPSVGALGTDAPGLCYVVGAASSFFTLGASLAVRRMTS